jgi:hypothetical protein
VAWSPLLLPLAVAAALGQGGVLPAIVAGWALVLGGALYALAHPTRGLQDLAAGTHLVPQ